MELPRVRRYRKGGIDRLYVKDALDRTLGWAETDSGETTVQIPGSEHRIEAAIDAWAAMYPEDDLTEHYPGRHTDSLAAAWDAEGQQLDHEALLIREAKDHAQFQAEQYRKGTSGERKVGRELNRLHKNGWGILHSIPIYDGNADLDHLIIGPGGVWTVNAKSQRTGDVRVHGDRMVVGRTSVSYIPAARLEVDLASRVLARHGFDVKVRPAIVFDMPKGAALRSPARDDDILILRNDAALKAFKSLTPCLEASAVNAIFDIARRRTTWEVPPT